MTNHHNADPETGQHPAGCTCFYCATSPEAAPVAWGREEHEACQAGTPGCSTDHQPGTDYPCETW